MLKLITGGAGSGKSTLMMDRIEECIDKNGSALAIIPDQFSFDFDRLLYKRLGMQKFNMVTVLSFSRLSADIFIKHGGIKGRYADDIVKSVLMYHTLTTVTKNEGLQFYNKQAKSLRFIESSLDVVKELMLSDISPEKLTDSINFAGENIKEKISDISVIYSEYARVLAESGYKDGLNDISEAAKRAASSGYFNGIDIFIDEFKSFTADERALLDVMISDSNSITLCLTTEEKEPSAFSVFETVNKTIGHLQNSAKTHGVEVQNTMLSDGVRFKNEDIAFASRNILRNVRDTFDGECENIRIYEAADIYNEADFICSEIRRLVSEQGYKYNEIAVAVRQKETYSSVMEGAFERYDIPFYTDENISISHKSLIVFAVSALKIAAMKSPDTEEYLRYIKTGFTGLDTMQINAVEDYCYKWNVTAEMWRQPFVDEFAEEIRLKITAPLFKLAENCKDKNGSEICRSVFEFFEDIDLMNSIKAIITELGEDTAHIMNVREYKQLWELLCGLLETLSTVLSDTKITLSEFTDLFELSAAGLKLSSPPQTLDSVVFVSAHTARLASPKAVFVIGVNDGELPLAVKTSGLFSDRDREALEAAGISLSGSSADKISEERFVAYNILSSPSQRLYVTYSLADVSGKALYPSILIKQLVTMFTNGIKYTYQDLGLLSFCTTAHSAYYQFVQNYNLENTESASLRTALMNVNIYAEKIRYLDNLRFNKQHTLEQEISDKLFGRKMYISPSAFEVYQKCPFAYFCKRGLNIYPRRRVDISASAQGNVIHYCLSELFNNVHNSGKAIADYDNSEIKSQISFYMDEFYNSDEIKGNYGKTKRFKETYKKLSNTIYDVAVHLKDELTQSKFVPSEFEYTIRNDGDESPLKLTADDGTEIYFIGTVDRVDVYRSGNETYIRVVDYKSGTQTFSLTNLIYGLNMQMFLYLFALTEKSPQKPDGKYKSAVPAGVLYMPAKAVSAALSRDDDDIQSHINKEYKMNGVLLSDSEVVHAMESEVSGIYIPVKLKKDGEFDARSTEHLLFSAQIEALRKYSARLFTDMASSLKKGKIDAAPLVSKNSNPCDYCDYGNICNHNDMKDCTRTMLTKAEAEENLAEILNTSK